MQNDQIPSGINNKSESTSCTAVFSVRDSLFWQKRAFLFGKGRESEKVVTTNKLQCVIFCCHHPLDEKMVT